MFLFLIVVALITFYFLLKKHKKNDLEQFPEPPAKFLFGHALEVSSTTSKKTLIY
jgi:hypothetical protein